MWKLCVAVLLLACSPARSQDYAEARSHFHTTLVRHEPSPQPQAEPTPPAGVHKVAYTSDGLTLTAWIGELSGSDRHPAVLFLHGGFAFDTDDWEMSRPFRDAGFVVMTPILRGEDGMPGDYSLYYNELDDVLAAADLLAKTPGIDPDRIYVAGHSAGGTLAMLAAMASHRFRAAASFSGVPDQRKWAIGQEQLVPFDLSSDIEFRMRSPIDFASSFQCPTRLYYGDKEPFLRASTPKLAALAASAGRDVVATQVPGNTGRWSRRR